METVETINLVDEYNKLKTENEQLQATIILILDACEDVNSPDRKARIEIRNRCREALKEKE